jgi:hypothetical protein
LSPDAIWTTVVSSVSSILPEKFQRNAKRIDDSSSKVVDGVSSTAAQPPSEPAVFSLRRADEMSLEQWVRMEAKEPLILSGHPGTGKLTLVRQVIQTTGIEDVVHIDVKSMLEKKDDMMVRLRVHEQRRDGFGRLVALCTGFCRCMNWRRRLGFSQGSVASRFFRKSLTWSRPVHLPACPLVRMPTRSFKFLS